MTEPLIPGGYILFSRRILESGIMKKPPLYFKIWGYLLLKAQHKEYGNLKRGQLFTSIPEIQEEMAYQVGFRTEKPTKKQIWGVLEWLRNPSNTDETRFPYEGNMKVIMNEPMIVTTKVTHGIVVTIVKYNLYQDPKNYEGSNEGNGEGIAKEQRREREGNNINKNVKNDKNVKNKDTEHTEIFNHWITKNIIQHSKITENMEKAMDKALKNYSLEVIKESISVYAEAYHSDYFYQYKHSLEDFLKQKNGLPDWIKEGSKYENYMDYKKKHNRVTGNTDKYKSIKDNNPFLNKKVK